MCAFGDAGLLGVRTYIRSVCMQLRVLSARGTVGVERVDVDSPRSVS